jgi:hypothetical protein
LIGLTNKLLEEQGGIMPAIPAICNNPRCGTVFPSGFMVENSKDISFIDCNGGFCPKCGSVGRVSDGTYDVIADEISALLSNNSDLAILERMMLIVDKAIQSNDFSSAKSELEQVNPNWRNVFNLLPEENVVNAVAVYTFFFVMLQTAISLYSTMKPVEPKTIINNSYEQFYIEAPKVIEKPDKNKGQFRVNPLTQAMRNNRA